MSLDNSNIASCLVKAINNIKNPSSDSTKELLDIVKKELSSDNMAIVQVPRTMYEVLPDGTQYGVIEVTTKILHQSGEVLEFPPLVYKSDGKPESMSIAMDQARKDSLYSIFGLAIDNSSSEEDSSVDEEIDEEVTIVNEKDVNQKVEEETKAQKPNVAITNGSSTFKVLEINNKQTKEGKDYLEIYVQGANLPMLSDVKIAGSLNVGDQFIGHYSKNGNIVTLEKIESIN